MAQTEVTTTPVVRSTGADVVRDSWDRSLARLHEPDRAAPEVAFADQDLLAYRENHVLALAMPVLRRLLLEPVRDTGTLVAVGDAAGRLLWVEGDTSVRRRAEDMSFAPGTDWSEGVVGTAAPGTALVLGRGVQIAGGQHFSPRVRRWSCTAVPFRDPGTGEILGVVDLTGGDEAVAPYALALVQAAVAAAQAELALLRLRGALPGRSQARKPELLVLGRDAGVLVDGDRRVDLSLRHTELLLALALHPDGIRLGDLGTLVNPDAAEATLRAEMVRLRHRLGEVAPEWVPTSRPYRLPARLCVDADRVLDDLARGRHRAALMAYPGEVLPGSAAPVVHRLRAEVSGALRDGVMSSGSTDALLEFLALPEAELDTEAWMATLRRLPPRSPQRDRIVRHVEWLERELG